MLVFTNPNHHLTMGWKLFTIQTKTPFNHWCLAIYYNPKHHLYNHWYQTTKQQWRKVQFHSVTTADLRSTPSARELSEAMGHALWCQGRWADFCLNRLYIQYVHIYIYIYIYICVCNTCLDRYYGMRMYKCIRNIKWYLQTKTWNNT